MMTANHSRVTLLHMPLRHKLDAPNYCTEEGAHLLKRIIESYWRERGHDVAIGVHEMGFHPAVRAARFDLRSDMINGAPWHCPGSSEASPAEQRKAPPA
jgi:hypothetical protein